MLRKLHDRVICSHARRSLFPPPFPSYFPSTSTIKPSIYHHRHSSLPPQLNTTHPQTATINHCYNSHKSRSLTLHTPITNQLLGPPVDISHNPLPCLRPRQYRRESPTWPLTSRPFPNSQTVFKYNSNSSSTLIAMTYP